MKTVVYLTKNKVWAGEQSIDWDGVSLDEVFGKIKRELKVNEMRIVLGNDVSFVTAVKAGDTFLSRENVLKMIKSWMPFEISNDCFDWKEIVLAHDEMWVQIIALEKALLMSLSSAIKKHGVKVDLITAIGVLLGEKTKGREAPVILKWNGKENLSVLGIDGLVDLVVSDISDEDLMTYATQKWGLAVNPEEITMKEGEFNLPEIVFSEKTKGEDKMILNLPILKDLVVSEKKEETKPEEKGEVEDKEERPRSKLWIYLLFLLLSLIGGIVVMYKQGIFNSVLPGKKVQTAIISPTPTLEITPEPTAVDLSSYKLQVLNGSGVTGEAAKIKELLMVRGFLNVDIGNAEATTEGIIRAKVDVSQPVIDVVSESTTDYKMGMVGSLTSDEKYDLIIVVGSAKKL